MANVVEAEKQKKRIDNRVAELDDENHSRKELLEMLANLEYLLDQGRAARLEEVAELSRELENLKGSHRQLELDIKSLNHQLVQFNDREKHNEKVADRISELATEISQLPATSGVIDAMLVAAKIDECLLGYRTSTERWVVTGGEQWDDQGHTFSVDAPLRYQK